jgi:hypothetical protein
VLFGGIVLFKGTFRHIVTGFVLFEGVLLGGVVFTGFMLFEGVLRHEEVVTCCCVCLQVLYDEESKDMPVLVTAAGSGIGIGVSDQGRFSTYFHTLMEAGLAVADVLPCETMPLKPASPTTMDGGEGTLKLLF